MAVYENQTAASPVDSVEFTPVSNGNFSFFTLREPGQEALVKKWLGRFNQEILAETTIDGKPLLVTRGDKTQSNLIDALNLEGDRLALHHQSKGLKEGAWMLRSGLGMAGQGLQLASSLMRGRRDAPLFIFAISNIAANAINFVYNSQKSEDINRLQFLKQHVNEDLIEAVPGAELPSITDSRATIRKPPEKRDTVLQQANSFMKKHSVRVGELGLRYLGAFSMASDKTNPLRRITGWGSITGKTIAMASKAEDPYSEKPHTWIDTLREKVTFRAGGLIEAASFAVLSYDGFKNSKIEYPEKGFFSHLIPKSLRGKEDQRDYLSGVGAALFTLAYLTRFWAKFGEKQIDMEELNAHITDSLAQMPPEKLPQLMADTTSYVKEQLKEKDLDFGKVFTQLMTETYRYHQVTLNGNQPGALAETPAPVMQKPRFDHSAPSHLERLQRETPVLAEAQR